MAKKKHQLCSQKITDQKAKCSTTIRNTTFWYCGGTVGSTAGVPLFGTVVVLWGVLQEYLCLVLWGVLWGVLQEYLVGYCGGTVGSTAGVQFLVLVLCDGLSTAGTAFLYWALYWYGTVLCIGPQHNLETNKFSCEQASH